jgi:hypothetical protein
MTCCPTCGQRLLTKKPVKPEDPAWPAFLAAWWNQYGSTPVPARELHQLPEAQAFRQSIIAFGLALGKAWRERTVVNGRRVVLKEWGHARTRERSKTSRGTTVVCPTLWALVAVEQEIRYNPA